MQTIIYRKWCDRRHRDLRLALRLPSRTSIATGNILGSWFNEPASWAGESRTIPSTSASFNHAQRGQRVINYPSADPSPESTSAGCAEACQHLCIKPGWSRTPSDAPLSAARSHGLAIVW
jgi:hypothetical protein